MMSATSVPYKLINSVKYRLDFPDEWINTERTDRTGPRCCRKCVMFAFRDSSKVFSDYCSRCDNNVYQGKRRLPPVIENISNDISFKSPNNCIYNICNYS